MADTEYAKVEIEITRELAMRGERSACTRCPVALAINEHLRLGMASRVGTFTFSVCNSKDCFDGELPPAARRFVDRYDHKLPIDFPVKFKLTLPKHALKEV